MTRRSRATVALCAAAGLAACASASDGGPGIPQLVVVQPPSAALCVGDSQAFTAVVLDGAGHPMAGAPVRWSSSAPEAVSIDTTSGVAHALAFGAAQITATAGGVPSHDPAALDVPQDLVPEFVPDTVVLAPGDTMTLGVRLRRLSAGPVPSRIPAVAPFDSAVARLDSTGMVHAKAVGTVGLSLAACGLPGRGGVKVFTSPDSVTGQAYLWLSGPAELRRSLPARALNFVTSGGKPAFQVFSKVGSNTRVFVYEDTLRLSGAGVFALDSLRTTDTLATAACKPPRPFATYSEGISTALLSMSGGSTAVTTYAPQTGYVAVSGRTIVRMRGIVNGSLTLDTLQAIYTFSAPLKDTLNACP